MRFDFIRHNNIDKRLVDEIIKLKNKVWIYPYSSHLKWMEENIDSDDVHLLLWDDADLIGYMNIVNLKGSLEAWGIGNVVISPDRHGQKLGLLLMNLCDYFLSITDLPGILICKERLIGFYRKCGWSKFDKDTYVAENIIPFTVLTRHLETSKYNNLYLNRMF